MVKATHNRDIWENRGERLENVVYEDNHDRDPV